VSDFQQVPIIYRLYDWQGCDELTALPFYKVSFGETISADDTFTGTIKLSDPRVQRTRWERATRPNCSTLVLDVGNPGGESPWGGMVTARKYESKTHELTVTATTFGTYLKQRLQAKDYTVPDPTAAYWAANPADPTVIAAQIVHDALTQSLTMPTADAYCDPCGNVEILVNGAPPPSITGCTSHGIVIAGSAQVTCFGENACVVGLVGSDPGSLISDGSVLITPGTTVDAVVQNYDAQAPVNAVTVATITITDDELHGVVSPYELAVGMIVDMPDCGYRTTVIGLGAFTIVGGHYHYTTVHMSAAATATHSSAVGTIGGYYTVTMSAPATAGPPASEGVDLSFSNGSGPTPILNWIDGQYAKTQFQTVDAIVTALAQMGYGFGFDYSWDVVFRPGTTQPLIRFNIEYPRKGRVWPGSGIVIDLEQATEWSYTEDGKNQAIGMIDSGSAAGGVVSAIVAAPSVVIGDGYAPVEATTSHTQVTDLKQLQGLVAGDQAVVVWPIATMEVTMPLILIEPETVDAPNPPGVRLAALNAGDDVLVVVGMGNQPVVGLPQDPRWPHGLLFIVEMTKWKATINEHGVSTVVLTMGLPPIDTLPAPQPPTG
jgi:hypothetical protein